MYFQMENNSLLDSVNSDQYSRDIIIPQNSFFNQHIVSQILSQALKLIQQQEKAEKQRFNDVFLRVRLGKQSNNPQLLSKQSLGEISLKEISVENTHCSENSIQQQEAQVMDYMKKMFNYHQRQLEKMRKIAELCRQLERQNQLTFRNNSNKSISQQQNKIQIPKGFSQSFDLELTSISPNIDNTILKKLKFLQQELHIKDQVNKEMEDIILIYQELIYENQLIRKQFEIKSEKITDELFHLVEEVERGLNAKAQTELHIQEVEHKLQQEKKTTRRLQKQLVLSRQIVRSLTSELENMEKQLQQQSYQQDHAQIQQKIKQQYDRVLIEFVEEQNKKYHQKLKDIEQYYEKQFQSQKLMYQSRISSLNEHLDHKIAETNMIKTQLTEQIQVINSLLQSKGKQIIELEKQLLSHQRHMRKSQIRDPQVVKLLQENNEIKKHLQQIMQEWQRTENKCKSLQIANIALQKKLSMRVSRQLSEQGSNVSQSTLIRKLKEFERVQSATKQKQNLNMSKLNRQKSTECLNLMKKNKNQNPVFFSTLQPQRSLARSKTHAALDCKNLCQSQIQQDEECFNNFGVSIKVSQVRGNQSPYHINQNRVNHYEELSERQKFHRGIHRLNFIKRQLSREEVGDELDYQ